MRKNIVALILMSCAILYAQDDGKGPTFLPVDPVENFYSGAGINLEVLIDDQSELGSAFLFYKFEHVLKTFFYFLNFKCASKTFFYYQRY